jgi:hypothetical protein
MGGNALGLKLLFSLIPNDASHDVTFHMPPTWKGQTTPMHILQINKMAKRIDGDQPMHTSPKIQSVSKNYV